MQNFPRIIIGAPTKYVEETPYGHDYIPATNECKLCFKPGCFPYCEPCREEFRIWTNNYEKRNLQIEASCNDKNSGMTSLGVRFR